MSFYHVCRSCNGKWFANEPAKPCPRCGGSDVTAEEREPPWEAGAESACATSDGSHDAKEPPKEILLLQAAEQALSRARSLDEIKDIRDKAEAARKYAESACLGLAVQNQAAEVKILAERKAGQLLAELRLAGGDRKSKSQGAILKLEDLGVRKDQSSRWQKMASVSDEKLQWYILRSKKASRELTSAGVLRLATPSSRPESSNGEVPPTAKEIGTQLRNLIDQDLKFGCIYADPPWPYANQATRGATSNHYSSLDLDALCRLPVRKLAEDQAHLHLWTTNSFLFEAKSVLEAWGFTYKSCFVWVKPQIGLGNYWRVAHEFLLLGVRGQQRFNDLGLRSWIEVPRERHSQKPDPIRKLVERASPGPYLEMFGRKPVAGWVVLGDELEQQVQFQDRAMEELTH